MEWLKKLKNRMDMKTVENILGKKTDEYVRWSLTFMFDISKLLDNVLDMAYKLEEDIPFSVTQQFDYRFRSIFEDHDVEYVWWTYYNVDSSGNIVPKLRTGNDAPVSDKVDFCLMAIEDALRRQYENIIGGLDNTRDIPTIIRYGIFERQLGRSNGTWMNIKEKCRKIIDLFLNKLSYEADDADYYEEGPDATYGDGKEEKEDPELDELDNDIAAALRHGITS